MDAILQWGLDMITAIQQFHGPVLDDIFRAITSLGSKEFFLLLLPLLFWSVNFGLGARIAIILFLSGYLNAGLKDLFQQPRPFELDPSVRLDYADGYGLPSGHAQTAVVVWGSIAAWFRKRWLWPIAIGLMFLIGFSRIYLGVHFPTDVLAGWAIGAGLLMLYLIFQPEGEAWLAGLKLGQQISVALVVPLGLLLIHPVKDTTTVMAASAGAGVGLVLMHRYRYPHFNPHDSWRQRILRFLIGGLVLGLLYLGPKLVFPGEESPLYLPLRFVRFGLIGLWVSLGAPLLFRRLRLM
jgi:undecaprenyl-diphosphatase